MKTVLSIGAHPDDIEIGCGGSEILLRQKGYALVHLVMTNGEEGHRDFTSPESRQEEARKSAELLGAHEVIFFGLPDGLTSFSKQDKVKLIQIIRRVRPQIVFTHASSDDFSDHRLIHQLTLSALSAAQGPWYPGASGGPHRVATVLGYEVWHPLIRPQMTVDISSVVGRKLAALDEHRSQLRHMDYHRAVTGLAQYRAATHQCGTFAESFEVIQTESPTS